MALENTALQNIYPLAILITPFGIMEIFSYGLAISRSGMLIYDLFKKKSWKLLILINEIIIIRELYFIVLEF